MLTLRLLITYHTVITHTLHSSYRMTIEKFKRPQQSLSSSKMPVYSQKQSVDTNVNNRGQEVLTDRSTFIIFTFIFSIIFKRVYFINTSYFKNGVST